MIFPHLHGFTREVVFYEYSDMKVGVRYKYPDGEFYKLVTAHLELLSTERKHTAERLESLVRPEYDLFMSAIDPDNQT